MTRPLARTWLIVAAAGCWTSAKPTTPVEPPPADAGVVAMHYPPPPLDEFEAMLAKLTEFKDALCQCTSTACAQQVSDDMTKWSQEVSKEHRDPPKMDDDQIKRATAIGEEMGKCMMQAMSPPPATP